MRKSIYVICVLAGIAIGCATMTLAPFEKLSAKNPTQIKRWEHTCTWSNKRVGDVIEKANKLGKLGWEGFGVGAHGSLFMCFKRPLRSK